MPKTYQNPVKRAVIAGTSGDNTLVAAVTGAKIKVLSYYFVINGAGTVRFESGAGGTALTGVMTAADEQTFQDSNPEFGCFETAAGALLNMELATSSANGYLNYVEV